ncbi:Spondin-1 [Clonorchis sinensis]|uniref:Spondin-1 n=1 Tax=Clonorchis sinensis TaxID=79923 RepID=A0A3R7C1T5_CLOSI|nr:Spondin-1 [Clonorchis sinensis]
MVNMQLNRNQGCQLSTIWWLAKITLIFALVNPSWLDPAAATENCRRISSDSNIIRRPGDGGYEIRVRLIPLESTRLRGSGNRGAFWPLSLNSKNSKSKSTIDGEDNSTMEYLPGREYEITIAPKASPAVTNTFYMEAVYVTAVPLGTPESQEYDQGKGLFSPTICTSPGIGGIEFKYNFPRQVTFIWTAPKDESGKTTSDGHNQWGASHCVELRAIVIPWHWHRVFFRNTGSLRKVMCPAKDIRQIDHWPNFVEDLNGASGRNGRSDGVKARSVTLAGKPDSAEARDRFSDSGFYGAEDSGSCAVQEIQKPVRRCCACNTAIYRMIIQSDWQQQQHWRDWPTAGVNRDGITVSPHFSEILGVSHSPLYDLFHVGGYASPAVDALCTTSDVAKLENEFKNQAGENIMTVIRTRGIDSSAPPEQRIRSALFAVNSTHHLISFLTRLVPSPDWCTGLSRVDICLANCSWPLQMRFRLEPWDAGVMSGNTYVPVEPSERLRQPKPMCPITPDLRANTPFTVVTDYVSPPGIPNALDSSARVFGDLNMDDPGMHITGQNPFADPMLPSQLQDQMRLMHGSAPTRLRRQFAPLGTVTLELLRINEHEVCTPEPAQDDQGFTRVSHAMPTSKAQPELGYKSSKCQLSSWSPWGPCSVVDVTTCKTAASKAYWSAKQPRMQRTRLPLPPFTVADCVDFPLKEEKTCSSPTVKENCEPFAPSATNMIEKISAEACQSLPWGSWSACINATCTKPGLIYRWREFPDLATKEACESYPLVNELDTCWPPTNLQCDPELLRKACYEEPPSANRLCLRPENTTVRYYYHPSQKECKTFDYSPQCHIRALVSDHAIAYTRNQFPDLASCERLCKFEKQQSRSRWSSRYKRASNPCNNPPYPNSQCGPSETVARWYFDQIKKQCLQFSKGECGSGMNRFATENECQATCVPEQFTIS